MGILTRANYDLKGNKRALTTATRMQALSSSSTFAARPTRGSKVVAYGGGKGVNNAKKMGNTLNDGTSKEMAKKGWVDPQGREGKGYGVYRFEKKYGANVDGYSPIYSPNEWSETGESFTLGIKGLLAWGALVVTLLGIGGYLVFSTSQLGN